MRHLLYVIAILFLVLWAIGAFVYTVGKIIHIFLVFALISILIKRLRYPAGKEIRKDDDSRRD